MNQSKITKGNTYSIPPVFHDCSSNPGVAGGPSPRISPRCSILYAAFTDRIGHLKDRSESILLVSVHVVFKTG